MLLPGTMQQTARVMAGMVDSADGYAHSSVNLFHCGDPFSRKARNPLAADFVQFVLVPVSRARWESCQ